MVPPAPWFSWPLEVGGRWTHKGVYEDPTGTKQVSTTFQVEKVETIEVPAGRFEAFKVVREGPAGHRDTYWYAPVVGSWVRWRGQRGERQFEEQLVEFQAAPRGAAEQETGSSFPRAR